LAAVLVPIGLEEKRLRSIDFDAPFLIRFTGQP